MPPTREIKKWNDIMGAAANEMIAVKASSLFSKSKWRICMIKPSYRLGSQKLEPYLLCKPDESGWIYGRAATVRSHNALIIVKHLKSEKLIEYIETHLSGDACDEPRNGIESTSHRDYQDGHMSIRTLQPILTQRHWERRNELEILKLLNSVKDHLLKRKNAQLNKQSTQSQREQNLAAKREIDYNYSHIMKAFAKQAFYNNLNYQKRTHIQGKSRTGKYATHLAPNQFKKRMRGKMMAMGGRQTVEKASEACWRADNLTCDQASKIVCVDYATGERLQKTDAFNWTYKSSSVTLTYSMKTLALGATFKTTVSKKGRRHRRS